MAKEKRLKLSPLYDKILVKRIEQEKQTEGGLIIPDAAQENQHIGTVKGVGHGAPLTSGELRPLSVRVGDQVMWEKYAGIEIKLNGEDLVILSEDELCGIIKEER